MPQAAIPIIGMIAGGLVQGVIQNKMQKSAMDASNNALTAQLAQQDKALALQQGQMQQEQDRLNQMQQSRLETDAARKARAEQNYLTQTGGAAGEETTLAKRTLLGLGL